MTISVFVKFLRLVIAGGRRDPEFFVPACYLTLDDGCSTKYKVDTRAVCESSHDSAGLMTRSERTWLSGTSTTSDRMNSKTE